MSVRRMSAHPTKILGILTAVENKQPKTDALFWVETSSPKAEVTSSNLVGRASSVVESKWPELAHKPPP